MRSPKRSASWVRPARVLVQAQRAKPRPIRMMPRDVKCAFLKMRFIGGIVARNVPELSLNIMGDVRGIRRLNKRGFGI